MNNCICIVVYYICVTISTLNLITAIKTIEFQSSFKTIPLSLAEQKNDTTTAYSQTSFQWPQENTLHYLSSKLQEKHISHYKNNGNALTLSQFQEQIKQQQQQNDISENRRRRLRSPIISFSTDFDDILDFSTELLTQISTIINGHPIQHNTIARPVLYLVPPRPGRNIPFRPNFQPTNQQPNYYLQTTLTLPYVHRLKEFRPKRFMYPTQRPSITVNRPLPSSVFGPSKTKPLTTNIFDPAQSSAATINQQRPLATNIFSPVYNNGNGHGHRLTTNIFPK